MRIRTIKNCMKDGVHSIVRNGLMSIASIGTISACLFILGITYIIVMNAQQFVQNLDSSLGIVAFLQPEVDEADAIAYAAELQARDDVKKLFPLRKIFRNVKVYRSIAELERDPANAEKC